MNRGARLAAVAVAMTAAVAAGGSAYAVGTGGVELTPLDGGTSASSFHVHLAPGQRSTQKFLLRNETAQPSQFQLYAAAVYKSSNGSFSVDGPGTAPWISLRTQTVILPPNHSRTMTFQVRRTTAQRGPVVYGAVVLAITDHQVVSRAAALVYLERPGSDPVRRAVVPLVIAVAVIAAALLGQVLLRRRRVVS